MKVGYLFSLQIVSVAMVRLAVSLPVYQTLIKNVAILGAWFYHFFCNFTTKFSLESETKIRPSIFPQFTSEVSGLLIRR
jgi:hypothetical protein